MHEMHEMHEAHEAPATSAASTGEATTTDIPETLEDVRVAVGPASRACSPCLRRCLPRGNFVLVNDQDLELLYYQLSFEYKNQLVWDYLESGPEVWRVRIVRARTSVTRLARGHSRSPPRTRRAQSVCGRTPPQTGLRPIGRWLHAVSEVGACGGLQHLRFVAFWSHVCLLSSTQYDVRSRS